MKRLLLLSGLSILSLMSLASQQAGVNAREVASGSQPQISQVASITNWQGASFPVENFQGYTSLFGYRRSLESVAQEFHPGLDMSAPAGSYIRNWLAGQVIEVSDNTACGTSIKIKSGDWVHTYCHLQGRVETTSQGRFISDRSSGIQIWQGQQLPSGARIGRVGMTGRTTGPHLHWGLQYQDQWINPALVLQEMYEQQQDQSRPVALKLRQQEPAK